jgi:hypothetical protein
MSMFYKREICFCGPDAGGAALQGASATDGQRISPQPFQELQRGRL